MKLERRLANLGYGSRAEVRRLFAKGRVTTPAGERLHSTDDADDVFIDGEPLDPGPPIVVLLHKPLGLETSRAGDGPNVFRCLPPRFLLRRPVVSPVGRLDKDSSGLLLLTDDGALLHRLTHPRHHVPKTYRVQLDRDVSAQQVAALQHGGLLLRGEDAPLLPASIEVCAPREATVTIHEGRYHQVRRMWAAVGNHVLALHRERLGTLDLGALPVGEWRHLTTHEVRELQAKTAVADAPSSIGV